MWPPTKLNRTKVSPEAGRKKCRSKAAFMGRRLKSEDGGEGNTFVRHFIEKLIVTQRNMPRIIAHTRRKWVSICQQNRSMAMFSSDILLRLADQTLIRLDALCPFSPTPIVQSSLLGWKASFGESCINDRCCHTRAAASNDGLGCVNVLGLENFSEPVSWQKRFAVSVEKVADGDRDRVRDVSGRKTWPN